MDSCVDMKTRADDPEVAEETRQSMLKGLACGLRDLKGAFGVSISFPAKRWVCADGRAGDIEPFKCDSDPAPRASSSTRDFAQEQAEKAILLEHEENALARTIEPEELAEVIRKTPGEIKQKELDIANFKHKAKEREQKWEQRLVAARAAVTQAETEEAAAEVDLAAKEGKLKQLKYCHRVQLRLPRQTVASLVGESRTLSACLLKFDNASIGCRLALAPSGHGLVVSDVAEGCAADAAGLLTDDMILSASVIACGGETLKEPHCVKDASAIACALSPADASLRLFLGSEGLRFEEDRMMAEDEFVRCAPPACERSPMRRRAQPPPMTLTRWR